MRTKQEWYEMALRWLYEHGVQKHRPTWVNQAIDMAYAPVRVQKVSKYFPPDDLQIPSGVK